MKKVQIIGILNCTPDSFFDGGQHFRYEDAIDHGMQLYKEGADMIDIGGESSRPNAPSITAHEEIERVLPVIRELKKCIPIPLSIDTCKPEVAHAALKEGVSMINDITGLSNPEMISLVKETKVTCCVMHMQGNPKTMQVNPSYPKGAAHEIYQWFQEKIENLIKEGIQTEQLILDPGIGFGKTVEHTIDILENLSLFRSLSLPLLVALSRKSFMSKILNKPPTELLSTTVAMNTMCIQQGVDIIRVHDVAAHRDVIDILARFRKNT